MPKCIVCGRYFDDDSGSINLDPYTDTSTNKIEDPLFGEEASISKNRPVNICKMCQKKLNRDAKEAQKIPKPM